MLLLRRYIAQFSRKECEVFCQLRCTVLPHMSKSKAGSYPRFMNDAVFPKLPIDRPTDHPSARIKFASRERCKFSPRKDSRRTSTTLRHARVTQKSHTKCSEENKVDYASCIFSPLKNWSLFRTRSNVVSLRRTSSNREARSLRPLGIGVNVIGGDSFCPSFLHASYFPSTPFPSLTAPLPVPLESFVVSQRSYISLLPRLLFLPLSYQLARNARRYVAAYSLTVYLQP